MANNLKGDEKMSTITDIEFPYGGRLNTHVKNSGGIVAETELEGTRGGKYPLYMLANGDVILISTTSRRFPKCVGFEFENWDVVETGGTTYEWYGLAMREEIK